MTEIPMRAKNPTAAQRLVLQAEIEGRSDAEIAQREGWTVRKTQRLRNRLIQEFRVTTRSELIAVAVALGWVKVRIAITRRECPGKL